MSMIGKKFRYKYPGSTATVYVVINEYEDAKGNGWFWIEGSAGPFTVFAKTLAEDYVQVLDKFEVGKRYYGQGAPTRFYEAVWIDDEQAIMKPPDFPATRPITVKHKYLRSNGPSGGWYPVES